MPSVSREDGESRLQSISEHVLISQMKCPYTLFLHTIPQTSNCSLENRAITIFNDINTCEY